MQTIHSYVVIAPLFNLGEIVITIPASDLLAEHGVDPATLLVRHQTWDWSDMLPESQAENRDALEKGYRILSSYKIADETVWVITEWDRSVTTILLPSDY